MSREKCSEKDSDGNIYEVEWSAGPLGAIEILDPYCLSSNLEIFDEERLQCPVFPKKGDSIFPKDFKFILLTQGGQFQWLAVLNEFPGVSEPRVYEHPEKGVQ